MADWNVALGALVLVLSISVGALLSRWYFAPAAKATRSREVTR